MAKAPSTRKTTQATPSALALAPGVLVPFILVTSLFFLWGVPNNLNDILIRQFMESFSISRFQAGLVQSAFYLGYFLLAIPSAYYMRKTSYKCGFVTGLSLFGFGAFLFWPAAHVGLYSFFLFSLFVMASGLAFLETASNTFISLCGSPETAERRLNFSQAFNPFGSVVGAFIGTTFIFSSVQLSADQIRNMQATHRYLAYLHSKTLRVVHPYIVLGLIALTMAFLIWKTRFPVMRDEENAAASPSTPVLGLLKNRHLVLTIITQFFYVGAQVGTWSYFIQYIQSYTGQSDKIAGYLLTGTLLMFGIGRFASAAVMKYIRPSTLMGYFCLINIALVAIAILHPSWAGVWTIFVTSFFMSAMYPTIFALGLRGLGADSKVGGSLIVMAIIGGAVLTPLMGIVADASDNIAYAYLIPLLSYACIAYYSFFAQGKPLTLPLVQQAP